ncbi:MAG: hypothetical protein U0360_09465 [Dehalococcoidia bacterium]
MPGSTVRTSEARITEATDDARPVLAGLLAMSAVVSRPTTASVLDEEGARR